MILLKPVIQQALVKKDKPMGLGIFLSKWTGLISLGLFFLLVNSLGCYVLPPANTVVECTLQDSDATSKKPLGFRKVYVFQENDKKSQIVGYIDMWNITTVGWTIVPIFQLGYPDFHRYAINIELEKKDKIWFARSISLKFGARRRLYASYNCPLSVPVQVDKWKGWILKLDHITMDNSDRSEKGLIVTARIVAVPNKQKALELISRIKTLQTE